MNFWGQQVQRRFCSTIFAMSSGHGTCGVSVVRITGAQAGPALMKMTGKNKLPSPRQGLFIKYFSPWFLSVFLQKGSADKAGRSQIHRHPGPFADALVSRTEELYRGRYGWTSGWSKCFMFVVTEISNIFRFMVVMQWSKVFFQLWEAFKDWDRQRLENLPSELLPTESLISLKSRVLLI